MLISNPLTKLKKLHLKILKKVPSNWVISSLESKFGTVGELFVPV
jgi:hypothetical protein